MRDRTFFRIHLDEANRVALKVIQLPNLLKEMQTRQSAEGVMSPRLEPSG